VPKVIRRKQKGAENKSKIRNYGDLGVPYLPQCNNNGTPRGRAIITY